MRKFIVAGGVLVLLIVGIAAALPFLIPARVYEGKVIAAVKQATGRDLVIGGPVDLGIFGGLSLQAQKVSLANAPGAPDPQMLTLGRLAIGLKLIPLLSGDVEITRLELTDPVVHLSVDKSGKGNWMFEPAATPVAAKGAPEPARPEKTANSLKQLHLGTVKISNGTFTYADARTGKSESVTAVDASLTLDSLDQPLTLSGNATWNGQVADLSAKVEKPSAAMAGSPTAVTLKLSSAPLKVDFSGTLATKPALTLDGAFAVSSPSLRKAAAWAGSPLKEGGSDFGPLSMEGKLALNGKSAGVSGLSFALDQIKGGGTLTADLSGKVPLIKGGLSLGPLDLNPYLSHKTPIAPEAAPVAAPVTPGTGWSQTPIDLSALKAIDVQLALDFTSLRFEKIEIGKSVVAVLLQSGRLNLAFKQMALYGGSGNGEIALDGSVPAAALNVSLALADIQIQPVLDAVMGIDKLSGTGTMKVALGTHGRSQHDFVAGLGGQGSLTLANGAIKGIDFASLAQNIQAVTGKGGGTVGSAADQTAFTTLGATFTIAGGTLANSDLALASPVFTLTGKGTANLLNRTLDYEVYPNLAGRLQGGKSGIMGTQVPILVQGPWNGLTYRPDVQSILEQKLKGKLPPAVQTLLGGQAGASGTGSKPADVLKGLFGR